MAVFRSLPPSQLRPRGFFVHSFVRLDIFFEDAIFFRWREKLVRVFIIDFVKKSSKSE